MKKSLLLFFSLSITCVLVISCTTFKVGQRDPKTGYFKTNSSAPILESKDNINLDSLKSLVLVPNNQFLIGMTKNLNFFNEVISFEEMEQKIIAQNLQGEIPTINSLIGLSNAAKKYKPFLYLTMLSVPRDGQNFAQLKLFNPKSGEYLFVSEMRLAYPSDQGVFYPLFNALIDYLQTHSGK
jgi:hypothetical protein